MSFAATSLSPRGISGASHSVSTFDGRGRWRLRLVVVCVAFVLSFCPIARTQSYAFGTGAFPLAPGPTAIVSGDFNGDGRTDIAVADVNGVSVLLGRPNGTFSAKVDYSIGGSTPTGLAVGDMNGDGKLDLIVVANGLQILIGNGNGTFRPPASLPLSVTGPTAVVAGDFNSDGKWDLAVTANSSGGPAVAILLGAGNGAFGTETDYPVAGSNSIITGDFNRDGVADLAIGYSGGGADTVSLLLGKGDGSFNPYISTSVPGNGNDSLAAGDFNRDGKLDLVVSSFYSHPGGISVLLGNGDGTFATAVSYPSLNNDWGFTSAVAVGDFNGDGKLDVACTNYDGYDLSVFMGVGDGTFKSAVDYSASINPIGLVTGDFNGDGQEDIASAAGYGSLSQITVLIGKGDGTFTDPVNHAVPAYPYDIAVGDFNDDGKPDLVVDSFNDPGSISVLLGKGNGSFTSHKDTHIGVYPSVFATGDFNNDGKLDVVVSTDFLSTLLGNGDGTLQPPLNQTLPSVPSNFAAADFNLDGNLDIATCLQLTSGVSLFSGKGDGTFAAPVLIATGDNFSNLGPVFSADLNGDHKPDLAVNISANDGVSIGISILLGDGRGSFQSPRKILSGYSLLAIGDFNGDGKADLAVENQSSSIGIALGKGDGTFKSPTTYSVPGVLSFEHSVVGDFNGDGKLDLASVSSSTGTLTVLPGNGDGTFGQRIDYITESTPWSLAAADFGDGGLSLAAGSLGVGNSAFVSILASRPVDALYPSSLQFGSQKVGTTSSALTTTLYNSGGAPMTVDAISATSGYAQSNNCGTNLSVGSFCTISVTFTPAAPGNKQGKLNIKDSSSAKTKTIVLDGVGVK